MPVRIASYLFLVTGKHAVTEETSQGKSMRRNLNLVHFVLMLTTVFCSAAQAQQPKVPIGAVGYVQLDLGSLKESNQFSALFRMISSVDMELSQLSIAELGLDLNAVNKVTMVLPPADQLLGHTGQSLPGCFVLSFTEAFDDQKVVSLIGKKWTKEIAGPSTIYVGNGNKTSVHFPSNDTIVVGDHTSVLWWANTKPSKDFAEVLSDSEDADVRAAVDLRTIPKSILAMLPPQTKFMTGANFASVEILFDEELDIFAMLRFPNDDVATQAVHQLRALQKQGRSQLADLDAELTAVFKSPNASLEDRAGSVAVLALIREGQTLLKGLEFKQSDNCVHSQIFLDQGQVFGPTMFVGIAAIGAATEEAESDVE